MRNAKGEEDPASITENEPKDDLQILSQVVILTNML